MPNAVAIRWRSAAHGDGRRSVDFQTGPFCQIFDCEPAFGEEHVDGRDTWGHGLDPALDNLLVMKLT